MFTIDQQTLEVKEFPQQPKQAEIVSAKKNLNLANLLYRHQIIPVQPISSINPRCLFSHWLNSAVAIPI